MSDKAASDQSMSERNQKLVAEFQQLGDWESRYRRIIELGKQMSALPDIEKHEDLKVQGCQSQVWIKAEMHNGVIHFQADSDALIVRGLVALLLRLYSGATPEQILQTQPEFISVLQLGHHLSPSRANGLFAMIKQIKFYAAAFKAKSQL